MRLAEENLPWNEHSLSVAKGFLSNQMRGGILASTDLYSSLGNIVPDAVADTEVNTAILLSDGDTYISKENQRKTIAKWSLQNAGKVSLFSLAAGKGNNLPLLDLLSTFNKGALYYTVNYDDIDKTLYQLIRSIQNPIGKKITAKPIAQDTTTQIVLYPRSKRLPDLYENRPYVFHGSINDIKDFYIFVQGKYYDKWLDIKQIVSFEKAKKVPLKELERSFALQLAYDAYDDYLLDGKAYHLMEVQNLLSAFKIQAAFQ